MCLVASNTADHYLIVWECCHNLSLQALPSADPQAPAQEGMQVLPLRARLTTRTLCREDIVLGKNGLGDYVHKFTCYGQVPILCTSPNSVVRST